MFFLKLKMTTFLLNQIRLLRLLKTVTSSRENFIYVDFISATSIQTCHYLSNCLHNLLISVFNY